MQLELVEQRAQPAALPVDLALLRRLVAALGHAGWWLNLVLADDLQMADLNRRWYGGKGPTDVLSFSYLEAAGPGDPTLAAGVGEAAHALWVALGDGEEPVTAGEVIIAPSFVGARCAREGWDVATEWALLQVHGALHVLGWTHDTDEALAAMRAREAALLGREGIAHPLPPATGGP